MAAERYNKIKEQMQLLQIKDVSTKRQHKNGTITWRLPIKNEWNNGSFIEVASFKSGYVRNNNSGYSNYQLNKRCESEPEYYEVERNGQTLYRKFTTRTCKLIPNEIDRLEYLIAYCLKNYYIKRANEVTNSYDCGHYDRISKLGDSLDESDYRIQDLERMLEGYKTRETDLEDKYNKLLDFYEASKTFDDSMYEGRDDRVKELENKLDTIQRIADHG